MPRKLREVSTMQHLICSIGHGLFLVNADGMRKLSPTAWNSTRDIGDAIERIAPAMATTTLTITTRAIDDIDPAEPIGPEALDLFPDLDILIGCPEGFAHAPTRWIWLVRPAGGELRSRGVGYRFVVPATLRRQIAGIFNLPNVDTDTILPSPKLRALEKGEETLELWLRPNWNAKALLPDQIREVQKPPASPLDSDAARFEYCQEKEELEKRHAQRREDDRRFEEQNRQWAEDRAKERAEETKRDARAREVRARVEREMGGR
jgi:hypothetical protein